MDHFHENVKPVEEESSNVKLGLWLFAIYSSIYGAFVVVAAFRADWMAKTVSGVNLAVLSGLGLIVGAIMMAALYLWLCRAPAKTK